MLDPHSCRRLLIYGGSFDPPHRAHLTLPFNVAERIGADGVMFIPAGHPPHKNGPTASGTDRVAMLRAGLGERADATICTWEIDRNEPSYTVHTLEHLHDELGASVELRLLIGADMAAMFYQWRQPRRIIELAEPVVMMRPPFDEDRLLRTLPAELDEPDRRAWRERIVACDRMDIASTAIRTKLEAGAYDDALVRAMLTKPVIETIRRRGLYRVR